MDRLEAMSILVEAVETGSLSAAGRRLVVTTAEAAVDAAIAGIGVTRVLSYQCAQAVRDGTLATVPAPFEPAPRPLSLIHAGQGLLPLKARAFLDFAATRLRKRLADQHF